MFSAIPTMGSCYAGRCGPLCLAPPTCMLDNVLLPFVHVCYFRGMLRSLWVGVLIAIPSGAGVALSVLGGNAGSLVGVAISASLLPPACNAVSFPQLRSFPLFIIIKFVSRYGFVICMLDTDKCLVQLLSF